MISGEFFHFCPDFTISVWPSQLGREVNNQHYIGFGNYDHNLHAQEDVN